jgi:hypothetical protein
MQDVLRMRTDATQNAEYGLDEEGLLISAES